MASHVASSTTAELLPGRTNVGQSSVATPSYAPRTPDMKANPIHEKDFVQRLVARARLSYFASTSDCAKQKGGSHVVLGPSREHSRAAICWTACSSTLAHGSGRAVNLVVRAGRPNCQFDFSSIGDQPLGRGF